MISASQFAHSYSSFWQASFPALENYVRVVNSGAYERSFDELAWPIAPERSALVSEVGYCLANPLYKSSISKAHKSAISQLGGLPGVKTDASPLKAVEKEKSKELAHRIVVTAKILQAPNVKAIFEPEFQGYGAVFKAFGDMRLGTTLVELKTVDRGFRGTDFRQLLTYCLLNSFSKKRAIERICLINPRRGTYYYSKLSDFVFDTSASTFPDIQLRFASAVGIGGTSR